MIEFLLSICEALGSIKKEERRRRRRRKRRRKQHYRLIQIEKNGGHFSESNDFFTLQERKVNNSLMTNS
jgi:hypothetical protein